MLTRTTITVWSDAAYDTDPQSAIERLVELVNVTDGVEYVTRGPGAPSGAVYDPERMTWVVPGSEIPADSIF